MYEYTERNGKRVQVRVARDFDGLNNAFNRVWGLWLVVTDGTRTRSEQRKRRLDYLNGTGSFAAPEGQSNHEEDGPIGPCALDVHDTGNDAGVTVAGSPRANWLRAHAHEYGFKPAGYSFRVVEPWHIEDTNPLEKISTITPASIPTDIPVGNPFGIPDVRGLQKIARLYGAETALDNKWGPQSSMGFTQFLRKNYRYTGNNVLGPVMTSSIARWLRARWGYIGNDVMGPVMRLALERANTANYQQLK